MPSAERSFARRSKNTPRRAGLLQELGYLLECNELRSSNTRPYSNRCRDLDVRFSTSRRIVDAGDTRDAGATCNAGLAYLVSGGRTWTG